MKRYGHLYEKIYNIDNIRFAHHNARKGKKHYYEVKIVDANLEFYAQRIHKMLKNKTFKNSDYIVFKRIFGKKEREIFKLPYFPDRIIHIKTSFYNGFVYNMETTKSYYIANGIAIHKCEGTWVAAP